MIQPEAKGWCPGALRPMMSGDGLVVRIRPQLGRLTAEQVLAICDAADVFGSGIIELTSRANVQLRGVTLASHPGLVDRLQEFDLLDDNAEHEARNNIIVTPYWQLGDDTFRIATELRRRLGELPELPTKFGFAVDAGEVPLLATASADVRVERNVAGDLIVRCDGAECGDRVTVDTAVGEIIAYCRWFVETGGASEKRMKRHIDRFGPPSIAAPLQSSSAPPVTELGASPIGAVYGAAFGRFTGKALACLMTESAAVALRTTPWRRIVLEGAEAIDSDDFITDPSDPIQFVDACPGAPFCASATVETHWVARMLAGAVSGRVHVSGCAKGCARSTETPITLVGRDGKFDIVRNGRASDVPDVSALDPADVTSWLGAH